MAFSVCLFVWNASLGQRSCLRFFFNIYYFWLYWVLVAAHGLPLVVVSRSCSPVVHGLLRAVASLVALERRL